MIDVWRDSVRPAPTCPYHVGQGSTQFKLISVEELLGTEAIYPSLVSTSKPAEWVVAGPDRPCRPVTHSLLYSAGPAIEFCINRLVVHPVNAGLLGRLQVNATRPSSPSLAAYSNDQNLKDRNEAHRSQRTVLGCPCFLAKGRTASQVRSRSSTLPHQK